MGHVRLESVSKVYKRYANRWSRLIEWLDPEARPRHEPHWVLRDVSLDVRPGESVGIVGANGAGKSTLLKIVTGTTRCTDGRVEVGGRVAALLELGMGFHPEFTGRQNAFMAGQLLGLSTEEIASVLPAIEAFADIGDYVDQPVRTYSSGMQMRLAFSVATAVRPDVLIVDEALSVGDVFFQQKCFDRIREYRAAGTTLLFVTHDLGTVYSLCDRAVLLHGGEIVLDADPKRVIDLYQRREIEQMNRAAGPVSPSAPVVAAAPLAPPTVEPGTDEDRLVPDGGVPEAATTEVGDVETGLAAIERVVLVQDGAEITVAPSDSMLTIEVHALALAALDDPHVGFQLRDAIGAPVFMTNSHCMRRTLGPLAAGERIRVGFSMRIPVAPGEYTITAGVAEGGLPHGRLRRTLARRQGIARLVVASNRRAILWTGVCNLDPELTVARAPARAGGTQQPYPPT